MVEKTSTCDPHIERKTLQVYPHLLQAVCFAGGCGFLNQHLPLHWIGLAIAEDRELLRWLPKSPAPTPCDVFLWGYVKVSLYSLYHRICLSCETKNHRCLLINLSWHGAAGVVGNGLSTCLCVTKGGHTERLGGMQKIWRISNSICRSFPPFKCNDFVKCVKEFWTLWILHKYSALSFVCQR